MEKNENGELVVLECCLCKGDIQHHCQPDGRVYWTQGHNAEPVSSILGIEDGRCCDSCNGESVIPMRLLLMRHGNDPAIVYEAIRKQYDVKWSTDTITFDRKGADNERI